MNPIICLSCLVVVLGSLVWTASAEDDFESKRTRVIDIYYDQSVDEATKERNVPLLADFLDKYADRLDVTPDLRAQTANALREYKEEKANEDLVDDAPLQGGTGKWFTKFFKELVIHLAIKGATEGIKKATE